MSGGGSKPEKVKVSEGEKLQAQTAKDQYAYYQGRYVPLERRGIADAMQDYSPRLAGQATAGAMRATTGSLRDAALGGPVDSGVLGGGLTQSFVDASAAGRRERDDRRLDMLGVGRGVSSDASQTLGSAARLQTNAAIDDVQSRLAEQQAKNSTRLAIVGAGATLAGAYGTKALMNSRANEQVLQNSLSLGSAASGYTGAGFKNFVAAQRAGGGR
ncbi:hypothetical protein [Pseudomonas sp. RL]|uniref:hypothetical protein n=1 Tax=Pseudomonas sp. RL TaxID=1452718 RepID=UPI000481B3DE|nr:hypothetical protein [Pseudomonas sp. RL]